MKQLSLALFLFFCSFQVIGQKIVGRILDEKTGKPISNVAVSVEGDTLLVYTNYLGFFEIHRNDTKPSVQAHHISYVDVKIDVGDKEKVIFAMKKIWKELPQLNFHDFSKDFLYDLDPNEIYENEDYKLDGKDTIHLVNSNAKFSGGAKGLYNYVGENLLLDSIQNSINGIISVEFTVDNKGLVKDVEVFGDTLNGINEEIMRVFSGMPSWKPASNGSTNVDQFFRVEILFGTAIYLVVDETASFPEGINAFYEYAEKRIQERYPLQTKRKGTVRKVYVQFVVDRDGKIDADNISVMQGLNAEYDEFAVTIIKESSPWSPGTKTGKPVRQRMVIPIFFKLN